MIGVDLIGQIRRACFEQLYSIKEIVRLLSVSRTTVRKVIREQETEFKYEHSPLVAGHRPRSLSAGEASAHHRRWRRQQWFTRAFVETRVAAAHQ